MIGTSPNIHRKNRRRLGKGQYPPAVNTSCVISSTGTTNLTMTFALPVVVSGNIPATVATRTLVSQTIVSPTVVTQVWSGNVTTLAYALPQNAANVRTKLGGGTIGLSGVFS